VSQKKLLVINEPDIKLINNQGGIFIYCIESRVEKMLKNLQGQPLGIDIMYMVLADRNMQVRFGLKVVWGS
jgi:hypothetical protein